MVTVFLFITLIFLLILLKAVTDVVETKKTEEIVTIEIETMNEAQIKNNIYQLCLSDGFIENFGELKIYDPSEKDKDDLFDEVFRLYKGNVGVKKEPITRCIKNCITDEEITVVISPYDFDFDLNITNKLDKDWRPIITSLGDLDESRIVFCFCYSKREIEKVELEKQIEKLNIPRCINYNFDVATNSFNFYIDYERIEELTIDREVLSKEKIIQNIRECKKKYTAKHQAKEKIKKQIQDLFNK
jgi:hypothetical protein